MKPFNLYKTYQDLFWEMQLPLEEPTKSYYFHICKTRELYTMSVIWQI